MTTLENTAVPSPKQLKELVAVGREAVATWDEQWPRLARMITEKLGPIQCREGCTPCCFSRRFASASEAAVILEFVGFLPAEQQESIRLKVESTTSSIRLLRQDRACETEQAFSLAGGIECPLLERGQCVVYPVRPLSCRESVATQGVEPTHCRECPSGHLCGDEPQKIRANLERAERRILGEAAAKALSGAMLPEVLSAIWAAIGDRPGALFSSRALAQRSSTRNTPRDETWRDDGHDYRAVTANLVLPPEGDYGSDLTLLRQMFDSQELYDSVARTPVSLPVHTLYKRRQGCTYDWQAREFKGGLGGDALPFTVWMSDGLQERLMMWEAAKRVRGRVLCGGLGLGIFAQYALNHPRVQSIQVIEMNTDVIEMVGRAWREMPWAGMERCTVELGTIEEALASDGELFDTIYVDTWDAVYHEYLPHLNVLGKRAVARLRPGGEVLLWARDLMIRNFLRSALLLLERRRQYLALGAPRTEAIGAQYPMFHRLVLWLRANPTCSDEALLTRAYEMAISDCGDLGVLELKERGGAQDLMRRKYTT